MGASQPLISCTPPSHLAPFPGRMRPSGREIQSHSSTSPSDRAKGVPCIPLLGLSGHREQKTIGRSFPGDPSWSRERGCGWGGGAVPCPPAHEPGRAAPLPPIKCFSVQKKIVIVINESRQILIFFFFFAQRLFSVSFLFCWWAFFFFLFLPPPFRSVRVGVFFFVCFVIFFLFVCFFFFPPCVWLFGF